MIPQPYRQKLPAPTPRTIAKPPKSPLLGQAPSARPMPANTTPVRPEPRTPEAANAKMMLAQKMGGTPSAENRPIVSPQQMGLMKPQAQPPQRYQGAAPSPQQQAAANMQRFGGGGDYPNPEWQPQPSFLKTTQPYAPAPVGALVPATSAPAPVRYTAPVPSGGPVNLGIGAYNTTPVRAFPDTGGSFIPKSPVEMNPRYVPGLPNAGAVDPTIGPDGQTIPPRPTVPTNTTPLREEPITGLDPSGEFDWESLADALGIGGLQDQVKETTAKGALSALTTPLSEYGFNPEEMKAQEDQIIRQAAEAKAKLAQQMAGRGLGGSGLEIAGLGNVDVGALSAITDLQTENKALQIESRLNEIKTFLSAYGDQLDDETRKELATEAADLQREMFDYEKGQQSESDAHTVLNNAIAQIGADKWDPEALAWAYDQLDEGVDIQDILRELGVTSSGGEGGSSVYQQQEGAPGSGSAMGLTAGEGPIPAGYAQPSGAITIVPEDSPGSPMPAEAIEAAYDSYVDSASQGGTPPLSYGDWVYWNVLNSGTPPELWPLAFEQAGL